MGQVKVKQTCNWRVLRLEKMQMWRIHSNLKARPQQQPIPKINCNVYAGNERDQNNNKCIQWPYIATAIVPSFMLMY